MAMKDWKKTKNDGTIIWWRNKEGELLELAKWSDGWFLWKPQDRPSIPIKEKIKTKKEALAYAKAYMRKH